MSRHNTRSELDIDARYDDRRSTYSGGRSRHDDRYGEADISFRRGSGAVPKRERDSVVVKERDEYERRGTTPAFLRDDYGQTNAGAMVLRARDREDVTYAPPRRRRASSDTRQERDEIIIRRDETESRAAPSRARPREESRERDEIIIRRDERSESRPEPPRPRPRDESREREEIIIRRESRSESRPPPPRPRPREESREREEIIIRRDERSESVPAAPRRRGREESREREEIIIRRDERSQSRGPRYRGRETSREREEIIIRRDERDDRESFAPPRRSTTAPIRDTSIEREEIIIRRDEKDSRSRFDDDMRSQRSYRPPPPPAPRYDNIDRQEIIIRREQIDADERSRVASRRDRYEDDMSLSRPISHERSRARSHSSVSEDEIIIRRNETEDRGREQSQQEIIIRRSSRSRSPSPTASVSTRAAPAPVALPPPEPQIVYAPQIHQEVITHHRHIDHGYEVRQPPRREPVYSRPPSPPSPPPPPPPAPVSVRDQSEERIEIRRSETRNGQREEQDIVISRNERSRSRGPSRASVRERDVEFKEEVDFSLSRRRGGWEEENIREEAEYYNDRALSRGYAGEAYHGATRDWGLVDIPPGTRRVRMDGAGGGAQEISWKRYDGNRRAKFYPDADLDEGYTSDPGRPTRRPLPEPEPEPMPPTVGPRYGARRDPRDGLWTELTKDLVVKEAIREMGYEFEETEEYYYIFKYMSYPDVARLVGLSEDIRRNRHRRLNEIRWENSVAPRPAIEPASPRAPLAIEAPPSRDRERDWSRDEERYVEREVVYRGGRPPPPMGWRRG